MTDIVERLRDTRYGDTAGFMRDEAAAEIERLRAALRRIEVLADQGIPNEATLNRIGHISGEALEHSRGACGQETT